MVTNMRERDGNSSLLTAVVVAAGALAPEIALSGGVLTFLATAKGAEAARRSAPLVLSAAIAGIAFRVACSKTEMPRPLRAAALIGAMTLAGKIRNGLAQAKFQ